MCNFNYNGFLSGDLKTLNKMDQVSIIIATLLERTCSTEQKCVGIGSKSVAELRLEPRSSLLNPVK